MECLANIFAGACKAEVQSIKSDDGEVDTKLTMWNMHKCITWTDKSQKWEWDIQEAQLHWGINYKHLPTPVLTRFAYLIHSFRYLLDNKPEIEYLYGSMPGIHDNIRARRPSLVNWEVIQIIVTNTKRIFGSIVLNQFYGEEWLLSEAVVDLVQI